ncbi:pumilio homolog 5-like [Carya illinoinensis]|uniref:PUM-HD domain-containing protein n=1 Tax=Carya illinoinensis TaxID=32201 RepID=A0A8T1RSD2_CARIL|nr:pumilio homolog 5-like [Carya illinoinensis]XP_042945919.1 pumilio homolog 5-like [Carya illinoinensis]XP_042945925.1 pumilio homolog 5-like [Carya illinoinensis]XP_042945930.1 pumilio homolog 5-like [Carya illinoinensis]KAG6668951.1 hypothetical protein CIPAW_01G208700 [Carya illinoinensis]KAG6668952.1 hypothetical protein CIPAW_01G208700 [Carya illinoinensis]
MATESVMGMVESSRVRKWTSSKDAAAFGFPLQNMAAEQLGLLLEGQRFLGDELSMVPNRSGSAPPSMEGSLASIKNLLMQHNSHTNSNLANLSAVPEEQLKFDPAYSACSSSKIKLNPRIPPPPISQENQCLVHQMGFSGNNAGLISVDDSCSGPLHLSQGSLSPHMEESEDDTSPRPASNNLAESSTALMPGQNSVSLRSRRKSLVDLIQEDFPRTPSPVYNQSHSSGHATTDGSFDSDVHAISANVSSIDASKLLESNLGSTDVFSESCALDPRAVGVTVNSNPSMTTFSSSSCPDARGSPLMREYNELSNNDSGLKDDVSFSGGTLRSDISKMKAKGIASNAESDGKKQEERWNMAQQHPSAQGGIPHQVQGIEAQVCSEGMSNSHGVTEKAPHDPNFSSVDIQSSLHSHGFVPPLYATMTSGHPYYPNFYPSGLFPSQYGVGGYGLSSVPLPTYMAAYPSHGVMPLPFDPASAPSFSGQTAGALTGECTLLAGDVQNLGKFYGPHGLMLQPSFVDPHQMLYYPHYFDNAYSTVFHSQLASTGIVGGQDNPWSTVASYMSNQKFQPQTNQSIPGPREVGNASGRYFPTSPNLDVMAKFPASPIPSSLYPSSPVGGMSHLGQHSEMRLPRSSIKNSGQYSERQGQRRLNSFVEPKGHSLLEELKSSNVRKFELSAIAGHIFEFSIDQHGSRFIQQQLEHCSVEDKASVFKEVLPHASTLMIDVFGNYVIQRFLEYGSLEQRKELADQLVGHMLALSLQMYGCRVIQKVLEVIEPDHKIQLVRELDGHVMRCVHDQNGNHVIQKCIESVPTEKIEFIISAFQGQVAKLSTHPYGCRVIQRILEHGSDELQIQCIVNEILDSAYVLAQDQYGNYVTQHVLKMGKPYARSQIIKSFTGAVVHMSFHKYASNVVEKCLEHGDTTERELLIGEIIGQSEDNDNLLTMMKDQFANYVVQKILETSSDKQREILLNRIRLHLHALKKFTYGKHIIARFEQLSGEEIQSLEEEQGTLQRDSRSSK